VLPSSKDGIILCSFALTQHRRVTDGQTKMLQLLQHAALWCVVKMLANFKLLSVVIVLNWVVPVRHFLLPITYSLAHVCVQQLSDKIHSHSEEQTPQIWFTHVAHTTTYTLMSKAEGNIVTGLYDKLL